jgi:arylsulfatase A-like enzyme
MAENRLALVKNIILIVVNGLRTDRLGCYGYDKPTSPNIDHMAEGGTLFENCYAVQNAALPCVTTILSGAHPLNHGIIREGQFGYLPFAMLQERLEGYNTLAIDNLATIGSAWPARGFDRYLTTTKKWSAETITDNFFDYSAREPFFALLHYYATRKPWYHEEEDKLFDSEYDCVVHYLDRQLGRIFENNKDSRIILTADHGVVVGQDYHGELTEEILHVPLILNYAKGGRETDLVSQQNIVNIVEGQVVDYDFIIACDGRKQIAIIKKDGITNWEDM